MLTLKEYEYLALKTAIYPDNAKIIYPALKLTGEAGEVADKIGKWLRGDYELDNIKKAEIAGELGDILWYIPALANDLGFTLEQIAIFNIRKLKDRKERNTIKGDGDNR